MREKQTEQKLVKEVKHMGGICPKFTSPGFDGMPDRIVLLPGGRMAFVEVKALDANRVLCRWQGMECFGGLAFECMCWTMKRRLEGY